MLNFCINICVFDLELFQINRQLRMTDDDSNSGFEMISSQPDKDTFEFVPDDRKYKFKIISRLEMAPKKVGYLLKKGLMLPYTTNSGGYPDKLDVLKLFTLVYIQVSK